MRDRVLGIETEYALIYHAGRYDRERPTNLALYRRFEAVLRERVRSLPSALSPLRAKGGRFLENGGTFHYEARAEEYEHGLLELASPECRDPYTLVRYERAKDELVEELAERVNRDLQRSGYTGKLRIGKNNVDSQGHTFGSHESYWVEDPLPLVSWLALLPLWLGLWLLSLPVLGFVLGAQIVLILALAAGVGVLLMGGLIASGVRRGAGRRISRWIERQARWFEAHPGEIAGRAQRLVAPLYPLLRVHSALYNRFFFLRFRRELTAFLVTRTLYTGAGAIRFDGPPLLRLAQRPPFLHSLARIFPDGEDRPVFETRDLFFRPWSALSKRRRLHILSGDANLCEWALALRIGATALVLEAIETEPEFDWPRLAEPLASLRRLNRDLELGAPLELVDTGRASALEIQWRYLDAVRRVLTRKAGLCAWKARLLDEWQQTLELLARDPEQLADRIDWIAKQGLLHKEVPDAADREQLSRHGARLVASSLPLAADEQRLRELAYRAWRIDLRYHELGPRGGHRRLERAGRIRRVSDPLRVREARTEPPADTRARARGEAIKRAHANALSGGVAWHRVRIGKFGWHWYPDPLDPMG